MPWRCGRPLRTPAVLSGGGCCRPSPGYGGDGDDFYRFNDIGDRADETNTFGAEGVEIFSAVAVVGEGIERIDIRVNTATAVSSEGTTVNTIAGRNGADAIQAGAGNDLLDGGLDADTLEGGSGVDRMYGGDGIDSLLGGAGIDSLGGGAGADVFLYNAGDGNDRFLDFSSAQGDKVDLTGVTFVSADGNVATLSDGSILTAQTGYV